MPAPYAYRSPVSYYGGRYRTPSLVPFINELSQYLPGIYSQLAEQDLAKQKLDVAQQELDQTQALFEQGQATEKELSDKQMALQQTLTEQGLTQQRELSEEAIARQREADAQAAKISGISLGISGVGASKTAYDALRNIPSAFRKVKGWVTPTPTPIDISPITAETVPIPNAPAATPAYAAGTESPVSKGTPAILPIGIVGGPQTMSDYGALMNVASPPTGTQTALSALKSAWGKAAPVVKGAGGVYGAFGAGLTGQNLTEQYGPLAGGAGGAALGALAMAPFGPVGMGMGAFTSGLMSLLGAGGKPESPESKSFWSLMQGVNKGVSSGTIKSPSDINANNLSNYELAPSEIALLQAKEKRYPGSLQTQLQRFWPGAPKQGDLWAAQSRSMVPGYTSPYQALMRG